MRRERLRERLAVRTAGLAVLAGLWLAAPQSATAQDDASADVAAPAADPIDPDAMAAVDAMSAALQKLVSFTVKSDATNEVVLEDGQKIQFSGGVELQVHRPSAFKVTTKADTQSREMYYDGKSFTIFAPKLGYFASFAAPSTIGQTVDKARTQFDIEVPLADLFLWGTDQTIRSRVQAALVVRPETIGNRTCMHYAFRQEHVDWQVWIDQGGQPLPCKLVITNRDDEAMPQYSAVLQWDLTTPVSVAQLAFTPPAGAHKIAITEIPAVQGEAQ
ncbi:DUF2092 domain-containing protein [Novosphingobium profundi]|nr:DUF2092 domain-containing protein [Novosphingobium profundi]